MREVSAIQPKLLIEIAPHFYQYSAKHLQALNAPEREKTPPPVEGTVIHRDLF